ncbi:MAG TPA: PBP1A family penicillin-binding protein [Actinomycetota bacterium]|nr:PBP1A family penicillin-binding protein [Actinomycetota bacterium]
MRRQRAGRAGRKGPLLFLAGLCALALFAPACAPPPLDEPATQPLARRSRILAADGTTLANLFVENRDPVELDAVPKDLIDAVIAAEDQRFWDHPGYDGRAIIRAALANSAPNESIQGGSTITQQLVKNLYFPVDRPKTLAQKVTEARLAAKMESEKSKSEILEEYLNTVYFGEGAYGLKAAAEQYFTKPIEQLTIHESAVLAAIIKSPERYNPRLHPDRATARRNYILDRMEKLDMISAKENTDASAQPLTLSEPPEPPSAEPFFVDYVKRFITSQPAFGTDEAQRAATLYRGGLDIVTSLDMRLQQAAKEAAAILNRPGDPEVAIVSIDPRTGKVLAMVGGRDWSASQVNLALGAGGGGTGRQPGSAFKAFVLSAAIEDGIKAETLIDASPLRVPTGKGKYWSPQNSEGTARGDITLQEATVKSVNTAFARLGMDIGTRRVAGTAERMGITSPLDAVPSISLGTEEVSPLDMASAYGTLANYGVHVQPSPVLSIESDAPVELQPSVKRSLAPGVAWLVTDILRGVITDGTGTRANIGRPAAGKTGTSQNYADAWFVGYTPELVTAVWVGYPDGQIPMRSVHGQRVFGGTFPAMIWARFMQAALDGKPVTDFQIPESELVTVDIDPLTGLLAGPFCSGRQTVQMLRQLVPRETCPGTAQPVQPHVVTATMSPQPPPPEGSPPPPQESPPPDPGPSPSSEPAPSPKPEG